MRRIKLSVVEKRLIRTFIIFVLLQLMIVGAFICCLKASEPIEKQDMKQLDIVVDNVDKVRWGRYSSKIVICSDSEEYFISSHRTSADYTIGELYETISPGDKLSIIYYERDSIFGQRNWVVDARTTDVVYRSIEGYYDSGQNGAMTRVIVLFAVFEVVFCGALFLFGFFNKNVLYGLKKKLKRIKK